MILNALVVLGLFAFSAQSSLKIFPQKTFRGGVVFVRHSPDTTVNPESATPSLYRNADSVPWGLCPGGKTQDFCAFAGIPIEGTPDVITFEVRAPKGAVLNSAKMKVRTKKTKMAQLKVPPGHVEPDPQDEARMKAERSELDQIYQNSSSEALWECKFQYPAKGNPTSPFGSTRTFNGKMVSTHYGVDLRGNEKTKVLSANSGRVVLTKELFNGGNVVVIDHGAGVFTSYSHLSQFLIKAGDTVKRGQPIGHAGSTGRATGPHIHWAVRLRDLFVDPVEFVRVFNSICHL